MSSRINILMTGGGAPGAAGILQCLQQQPGLHITIADANSQAVGRYLHHDFITIPRADDPAFIDTLLAICRQKNIHALIPLVTKELLPLADRVGDFALAGTQVLVSSAASLDIANNKSRLYQFLQWRGIATPAFEVVETVEQFKAAVIALGYPGKPICFKPSVSNGSRGFRIIDAQMDEAHLLFNEKPNARYIGLEDAIRILSSKPFPELLVSEYLPGDEYSVDCIAQQGQSLVIVPRVRKKMINGISVEGAFVQHQDIIRYCQQMIAELQLQGNIGIQVKESANNTFLVLEINPRVQGTIAAALGAGINLPLLAVKQALQLPINKEELVVNWGTGFSRYWKEVFY